MNTLTTAELLERLENVQQSGDGWTARCPAHEDNRNSLSITDAGDDVLCYCHAGCSFNAIMQAVGKPVRSILTSPNRPDSQENPTISREHKQASRRSRSLGKIIATYDYVDELGKRLFQAVRYEPKDFLQRHYNPNHPKAKRDGWVWSIEGVRRVLYRLPSVLAAAQDEATVYVVEGEKDVHSLEQLGLVATCNPAGAGKNKWRKEYSESLQGVHVVILPDNDDAGKRHAQAVAFALEGYAASVKVVELPGLPDKADVTDWIAQGHTPENLETLVDKAPLFTTDSATREQNSRGVSKNETPKKGENDGRVGIIPTPKKGNDGEGAAKNATPKKERGPSHLEILLQVAKESSLFVGEDGEPYGEIPYGQGRRTVAVRGKLYEEWLRNGFYSYAKAEGSTALAPSNEALQSAINTCAAKASFEPDHEGPVRVFLRSGAQYDDDGSIQAIYLDLADTHGQCVEITQGGFQVVDSAPIKLLRTANQHPLPAPDPAGTLDDLLPFLRTESKAECTFILSWIIFALHPDGPYPVLALFGPAGSGKTTMSKLIRRCIDPAKTLVRRSTKTAEDLLIQARHNSVVALENISTIPDSISDTLCSIATGTGFGGRTLYTNGEESSFAVKRPILLNGISEYITRLDLADRTVKANVPALLATDRDTESGRSGMNARFEAAHPRILGGICHALSHAIRNQHSRPERLPRMADFAAFIYGASEAMPAGLPDLIKAMTDLHDQIARDRAATSGIVSAFLGYFSKHPLDSTYEADITTWQQTLGPYGAKNMAWPENAQAFRSALRRDNQVLQHMGITITPVGRKDPVTRRPLYRATYSPPVPQEAGKDLSDLSDLSHLSESAQNGPNGSKSVDLRAKDRVKDVSEAVGSLGDLLPTKTANLDQNRRLRRIAKDLKDPIRSEGETGTESTWKVRL